MSQRGLAKGKNTNPFFYTPEIKTPLKHNENELSTISLKKIYEYDLLTKKVYIIELLKA